ncbi:MAG: hypothetical protein ABSH33_18470 [Steroidobacteraceae bacterium]|jgi:hypothetical protein
MLAKPLSLPSMRPFSYGQLHDEPVFDPARHLALEPPLRCWTLDDLGYTKEEAKCCASRVAIAGPMRLLSVQGAEAARNVALALSGSRQAGDRTASYLTGGVYRSAFLRDLCSCPEVTAFLSEIAGCELLPHSMPSQQIYINYAPEDLSKAVDTWHTDSIGLDCVLMISDPASFSGGQFQFFVGTRYEAASLLDSRPENLTAANVRDLPAGRVADMQFPAAGYAVFQQGTMVVHRATRLERRAERNTAVLGYVSRDVALPDPTADSIVNWGEPGIIAEFARHKAWLSRTKLDYLMSQIDLNASAADLRRLLTDAIADAQRAIEVIDGSSAEDPMP